MDINTTVGAYRQADLERMGRADLRAIHEWAVGELDAHAEAHAADEKLGPGYGWVECEACEYYELLAGAAADILDRPAAHPDADPANADWPKRTDDSGPWGDD